VPSRLFDREPDDTGGERKADAKAEAKRLRRELARLQERLYADGRHALLIVLQGMDAAGKDGTVRHVFRGVNPQGVRVHSFKQPTPREAAEDFLWRVHAAAPPKGIIGVYNRSHYEDVLVARVHALVPEEVWRARYRQINDFERLLAESGVRILKFFLHISKDEQHRRIERRLRDPRHHWKFSPSDLKEREHWAAYQQAYADAIRACSTEWAPWTVVPADHRWYRNLVVVRAVTDALRGLDLRYPDLPDEAK
jgi:PPK2 family polyphosphate:nucleotide phosphotransferase